MTAASRPEGLQRALITVCIMLATIMQVLDTTIANVALPYMQGNLAATQDQISWVLTSYIVASAIMTPPTGFLATRFGRKRVFAFATAGFTVCSMLCGSAVSLEQMVVYRILQGLFGAGLVPLSQAVLLDTYPTERHGSAMAIWGMGVMVGPILGPTLGGWLTEAYNWRWVFYVNLPVGLLALFGMMAFLPETERDTRRGFDFFGFALLSLAIGGLQLMLDRGESQDWFTSAEIVTEGVLAVLCLYLFLVHMFTAEKPFIEPGMFKDRNFVIGLLLIFVLATILISTMALLPPFLQNLMGFPVLTAGLVLSPRGFGTMAAMMVVGRLIGRVDARLLILTGIAILALSLWEMSGFTADVSAAAVAWTGVIQGVGFGLIFVPMSTVSFSTLAPRYRAEGTAMFSLLRNIGGSIGISVMIFLLARNTQTMHADIAAGLTPFRTELIRPWLPQAWDWTTQAGAAALNGAVTRQAQTIGYLNDFSLMMWVALATAPLLLLMRDTKPVRGR